MAGPQSRRADTAPPVDLVARSSPWQHLASAVAGAVCLLAGS